MKKFFLSALTLATIGFGFVSCNNGDYDANPKVDNSHIGNPINPNLQLGTIRAKFNGQLRTFSAAVAIDTMDMLIMAGGGATEQFSVGILDFTGVRTYLFNDTSNEVFSNYVTVDGMNFTFYGLADGTSTFRFEVKEASGNTLKGTFDGVLYKEDLLGVPDTNSGIWITEGTFFVPKQ